jgi:hypothetical protein
VGFLLPAPDKQGFFEALAATARCQEKPFPWARPATSAITLKRDFEMKTETRAFAKLNISLDVLKKRPDGFHDMRMIMAAAISGRH